jgi:hypothetical protein
MSLHSPPNTHICIKNETASSKVPKVHFSPRAKANPEDITIPIAQPLSEVGEPGWKVWEEVLAQQSPPPSGRASSRSAEEAGLRASAHCYSSQVSPGQQPQDTAEECVHQIRGKAPPQNDWHPTRFPIAGGGGGSRQRS